MANMTWLTSFAERRLAPTADRPPQLVPYPLPSKEDTPIRILLSPYGNVLGAETKGADGIDSHFRVKSDISRHRNYPLFDSWLLGYRNGHLILSINTSFQLRTRLHRILIEEISHRRVQRQLSLSIDLSKLRKGGHVAYVARFAFGKQLINRPGEVTRLRHLFDEISDLSGGSLGQSPALSQMSIFDPLFIRMAEARGFGRELNIQRLYDDMAGPPKPRRILREHDAADRSGIPSRGWLEAEAAIAYGACVCAIGLASFGVSRAAGPRVPGDPTAPTGVPFGAAVGAAGASACDRLKEYLANTLDELENDRAQINGYLDTIDRLDSEAETASEAQREQNEQAIEEAKKNVNEEQNICEEKVNELEQNTCEPEDDPGAYGFDYSAQYSEPTGGGTGGGCFAGDTVIIRQRDACRIDTLTTGDELLGYSQVTRQVETQIVKRLFPRGQRPVKAVHFDDGTVVRCTVDQPFFGGEWAAVSELKVGDQILGQNGTWCAITNILDGGTAEVFDVWVNPSHTLLVSPLGLVTHNKVSSDPKEVWETDEEWPA